VEAFEAAADPDRYTGCGEPWQPLKLYYFLTFSVPRIKALHEEMLRLGLESPYAERIAEWEKEDEANARQRKGHHEITTRVPCGDYFELRNQALLAHATQVDPQGHWFACPAEVQRTAWPTEDYYLARSVADAGLPEDDLFAGIRERVSL
jgi:mycothiol S-conjugate amidase